MSKLNRLLFSIFTLFLLLLATPVFADYCDGPRYCRIDVFGDSNCDYRPEVCGSYWDQGAVYYGYGYNPFFFGSSEFGRHHHHHHFDHWNRGGTHGGKFHRN